MIIIFFTFQKMIRNLENNQINEIPLECENLLKLKKLYVL